MVKAVALVRVSSTQQDYSRQISDLMPLITGDGYSPDEIAIVKHKESASKLNVSNRKTIQDLIDIINNNQVESVYVTEISRLSRRSDVLYSVLALLEERQIALVVQTPTVIRTYKRNGDKWERDAFAHIIIQFLEQAAVNEIENKTARQKSGYLQKQKDGKVVSSKVVLDIPDIKMGMLLLMIPKPRLSMIYLRVMLMENQLAHYGIGITIHKFSLNYQPKVVMVLLVKY